MATTFHKADDEALELTERMLVQHHPLLAEAGVRVGLVMASHPTGPAVRRGGSPK